MDGLINYSCFSSATGRIISSRDHSAVQISFAEVRADGVATNEVVTFALSGFVRSNSEGADSIDLLAQRDGLLKNVRPTGGRF